MLKYNLIRSGNSESLTSHVFCLDKSAELYSLMLFMSVALADATCPFGTKEKHSSYVQSEKLMTWLG